MSKKILIISQTPTHPQNAGNRVRIFNMASYLVDQGHDVHFLHSLQQDCDENAMKEYWKDRYHIVNHKKTVAKKVHNRFNKYFLEVKSLLFPDLKYFTKIDDTYNLLLDDYIKGLTKEISFDIVIVEYIFLSKALLNFDDSAIKIIDTHDVMTNRHKLFLKNGKKPSWFSTTAKEEKKGLDRADIIIAIQENEKKFFNKLTNKKVVTVGHILGLYDPVNTNEARKKLLFVGSKNPINEFGIIDFLENIYPVISDKIQGIELIIAGRICNELKETKGVKLLGEVESIQTAYDAADIVINPLILGTGLKIKMIEAQGYSKAVISTHVGAEGLEDGAGKSYLIANKPEDYVNAINKILADREIYRGLCSNAKSFAGMWNDKNTRQLLELINEF